MLKEIFDKIIIPRTVKMEVIDKGKKKGEPDAFLIDSTNWIEIVDDPDNADELAEKVGIHCGEACAIYLLNL